MVQNIIIPGRHILILIFKPQKGCQIWFMTQSPKRVFLVRSYAGISGPPPGISITTASERVFSWLDQKRHQICRASAPRRVYVSFFFLSQPNPIPYSILSITHSPSHDGLGTGRVRPGATPPSPCGRDGGKAGRGCCPFSSRGLRLEREARPSVDSLPPNPQRVERPTRTCADGRA